jgi:hypothetical protein
MNIFVVDTDPRAAGEALCDKHIPKMVLESTQILVSVLRRHGATDDDVPLTAAGNPHKGGYPSHPSVLWAGDSFCNAHWLYTHAHELCSQYTRRYKKVHACSPQLAHIATELHRVPDHGPTDVALCVGPEFQDGQTHAPMDEAVPIYRKFYIHDKARFAEWKKGVIIPDWWQS